MKCNTCKKQIDVGLKSIIEHQNECKIVIKPTSNKLKKALNKLIKNLI